MEATENSESLRLLHQTLTLLANGRQVDIEALCVQLEAQIPAFKGVLDKASRNTASRNALSTGQVTVDDVEYSVNEEFRQQVLTLSDTLDLDELDATRLFMLGQEEAEQLDRPPTVCAIIRFYQYRSYLLACLRLTCALSLDDELDEAHRDVFIKCLDIVVKTGTARTEVSFVQKCVKAMVDVERWLQALAEQVQKNVALNINPDSDTEEQMQVQQENLIQEHESLSMIVTYLTNSNRSHVSDFTLTLDHISTVDKWNGITVHYIPVLVSFTSYFGRSWKSTIGFDEAKTLNNKILAARDSRPWPLRHLQAACITWWLAEFNGWYFDDGPGAQSDSESDQDARSAAFTQALNDGAFQCTLSVCAFLKSQDWLDPSRLALTRSLLTDNLTLPGDTHISQPGFETLVMEQLEGFLDSFITNMPDVLRSSKITGDSERKRFLAGIANGAPTAGSRFLETFFLIVSYAFEGRTAAAELFWHDPQGNMYGFLQWASRRQTTPVVGAFCEMFRAISEGTRFAEAAHHFLLGDDDVSSSRMQKAVTLSWSQIFEELDIYASRLRHTTPSLQPSAGTALGQSTGAHITDDLDEPESNEMLECYLRLVAHLCRQTHVVRDFLLTQQNHSIIEIFLLFCRKDNPSRLRMTAYTCLAALLTDKSTEINEQIWSSVDRWITSDFCAKPPNRAGPIISIEDVAFQTIAASLEESNAFLLLLQALVTPVSAFGVLHDALPFPENLGSAYRMPGLDSYVDFIFGRLLCHTLPLGQGSLQAQILAANIMNFAVICLESFNEDLVILANRSNINVDKNISASSLTNYVRLHPFNRVMEWMFNERASRVLFHIAHHSIAELNFSASESPLVSSVRQSIHLISLILKLEPTYSNIVRPLVKAQPYSRKPSVLDASIAVFEDNIATHLQLLPDLLYYAGSGHHELALASMRLLTKVMSSKRLNLNMPGRFGKVAANRMISLLQQGEDIEPIARSLIHSMELDSRDIASEEFEGGLQPASYQTKLAILDFLETTLKELPDKPNLAHVLLGFDCFDATLFISDTGLFSKGDSLFHALLRLAFDVPEIIDDTFRTPTLILRQKVWQIVGLLWASPISAAPILSDLRDNKYGSSRWIQQKLLSMYTSWDHVTLSQEEAPFTSLVDGLYAYLDQRQSLLKYTAVELRTTAAQDLELARARMTSIVLGLSVFEDGDVPNPSIFDLLDFMEIDLPELVLPPLQAMKDMETTIRGLTDVMDTNLDQNLSMVDNLLALKMQDLKQAGLVPDTASQSTVEYEAEVLRSFLIAKAKLAALSQLRLDLLRSWSNLLIMLIDSGLLDVNTRRDIILQAIQGTTPKLDFHAKNGQPETLVFAHLLQNLLAHLKEMAPEGHDKLDASALSGLSKGSLFGNGGSGHLSALQKSGDGTNERLYNLFRVALRAAVFPSADSSLRAALYSICYMYLSKPLDSKLALSCLSTVKTMAEGLIETVCDDAYSGDDACRITATMLLDAFTNLEVQHAPSSTYVIETMSRANLVVVLTEAIERMPHDVQSVGAAELPSLLAWYHAELTLLLTLARTRQGANEVCNAGLFTAVAASGLFSIDPDVGLDIDDPDALGRFYELVLGVLRVIVGVVLSRGARNTQSGEQGRAFLVKHRYLIMGLLKRQAKIGMPGNKTVYSGTARAGQHLEEQKDSMQGVLDELSELLVLLISITGFVEEEEQKDTQRSRRKVYS